MLIDTPLGAQLAAQRSDRLRILIAGAGVAGTTLAMLLRQNGLHPVVIERMPGMTHPGYMLALMPTVDAALNDIGVRAEYLDRSAPLARYAFHSHRGRMVRRDDLGALLSIYGDYQGIERGVLLDVLSGDGLPVTFATTIEQVTWDAASSTSRVSFTGTGAQASFDLVVAADGIHSTTRDLLPVGEVEWRDTNWGGWVTWADTVGDPALGDEVWGDGFFLGVYPVKGRLGMFLGGPTDETRVGPAAFADRVRRAAPDLSDRLEAALDAVAAAPDPYFWPLIDVRADRWVMPGAVLLGDAAAGFLPTAGVGAGMAMESAWMLGRMLAHAAPATLPVLLAEWERTQKPRVHAAQSNSRMLARMMFRRGKLAAWLRESVMRVLTVRTALGPIIRLVAEQPDPEGAVDRALSTR